MRRIKTEINFRDEPTGLARVLAITDGPAVLCENVKGINVKGVPLLSWLWGSWLRTAMSVGARDRDEAIEKLVNALSAKWIEPVIVEDGSCKEVIIHEEELDLRKQIPKIYFWGERQAYITGGVTISRDPETGLRNTGTYRYGLLDADPFGKLYPEEVQKRELSGWIIYRKEFGAPSDAGVHYMKASEAEKPLEIAIAICVDPTIMVVGSMPIAYGLDELALAGAIRGAPVELVKCETVNLEVPATAEWVIEAEILPGYPDVFHWDGPHAEYHGHFGSSRPANIVSKVRVKCITHRKNPLWTVVQELKQPPRFEHTILMCMTQTASLYRIRDWVPFISKIAIPIPPGEKDNGMAIVQIERKPYPYFAHNVIRALWSCKEGHSLKYVIVVDKDIDPYDWNQVLWALWARVAPGEGDVVIERQRACVHWNDPAYGGGFNLVGSQMGIDATLKVPERFDFVQKKAEPPKELVEKVYAKIKDELRLKRAPC